MVARTTVFQFPSQIWPPKGAKSAKGAKGAKGAKTGFFVDWGRDGGPF